MASNDPDFERKTADIIGLYLDPPRHAAVFCVDEKTAIQALDRRDRVLPLSARFRVQAQRHSLPLRRLKHQAGQVHGKTAARHTSQDFVEFLGEVVARSRDSHHPRQPLGPQDQAGGGVGATLGLLVVADDAKRFPRPPLVAR